MDRHTEDGQIALSVPLDALPDPGHGISGKFESSAGIKTVNGSAQTNYSFAKQIISINSASAAPAQPSPKTHCQIFHQAGIGDYHYFPQIMMLFFKRLQ